MKFGEKWKTVCDVVDYTTKEGNKILKPVIYLDDLGLLVFERFQGMSIGAEILEAR